MTTDNEETPLRETATQEMGQRLLSDALLIALASGLAYMAVYSYDIAFCQFFHIPLGLIAIAVPNLVSVALIGLLLGVLVTAALNALPSRFVRELGDNWPILPACVFLITAAVDYQFEDAKSIEKVTLLIGALAVCAGVVVVITMEYLGRLRPRVPRPTLAVSLNFLAIFMPQRTAANVFGIVVIVMAIVVGARVSGFIKAEGENLYALTDEAEPKVILAIFGDTAVAAKYDPSTKTVSETFTLYELGKAMPSFTIRNIGPIKSLEIVNSSKP